MGKKVGWLTKNLGFKLLSLVLSVIIWLYISGKLEHELGRETKEITFSDIPVKALHHPEENLEVTIHPPRAKVVLEGDEERVANIIDEDILLFVDLGNLEAGRSYKLRVQYIVPKNISVNRVIPSFVEVLIKMEISEEPYTKE